MQNSNSNSGLKEIENLSFIEGSVIKNKQGSGTPGERNRAKSGLKRPR